MKYWIFLIGFFCWVSAHQVRCNEEAPVVDVGGYISALPSLYWNSDSALWQGLLHNRLNCEIFLNPVFSFSVQMRNQVMGGDFVKLAETKSGFTKESYFLPLTYKQQAGDAFLFSSSIDRLWAEITLNKLEVKVGRQRINWGQTFVWNPNDIFNSYNFFDFDYPERPGADAIRVQYYTSSTSSLDVVAKIDSSGYLTGAGLVRFTMWNTEFQFLAGYYHIANRSLVTGNTYDTKDLLVGTGFSAGISKMSIRGEMSYFYPVQHGNDSTRQLLASLTMDFSAGSKMMMMFEFFYNSNVQLAGTSVFDPYYGNQSVKTLSFTRYNIFGQVTYPILPILNGTFSGMYFFDSELQGIYAGPSCDLSLGNNLTLGAIFQIFAFRYENPFTQAKEWSNGNYAFLRFKWNF